MKAEWTPAKYGVGWHMKLANGIIVSVTQGYRRNDGYKWHAFNLVASNAYATPEEAKEAALRVVKRTLEQALEALP